eukprot:14627286-Ditylum_brightwellii.AAC.1
MDSNTSYSCHSAHFSLITAIDNLISKSPIEWFLRHVKGHQDYHHGPLNRWATLNVEMDGLAKTRRQ